MSFIAQLNDIAADLKRHGVAAYSMRDEQHLEMVLIAPGGIDDEGREPKRPAITWLEDDYVRPRPIGRASRPSPITFFLDGSQRTLRAFHCDGIPIVAGIVGAAILERDAEGNAHILPGQLQFRHIWVIPTRSSSPEVNRVIDIILAKNGEVVDPLDEVAPERYDAELLEFAGMIERAYKRVGKVRREVEAGMMADWCGQADADRGLLLVDGPLGAETPCAIGLVKSFTRQYLDGAASAALFRLRDGERTAAFKVEDGWRKGNPVNAWYQRHWDATGRDPRHALIRLEMSSAWKDQPAFDDVAAWIMRERSPAARADARWATLLYPVHFLEAILKRHLDAETRGWATRA